MKINKASEAGEVVVEAIEVGGPLLLKKFERSSVYLEIYQRRG